MILGRADKGILDKFNGQDPIGEHVSEQEWGMENLEWVLYHNPNQQLLPRQHQLGHSHGEY